MALASFQTDNSFNLDTTERVAGKCRLQQPSEISTDYRRSASWHSPVWEFAAASENLTTRTFLRQPRDSFCRTHNSKGSCPTGSSGTGQELVWTVWVVSLRWCSIPARECGLVWGVPERTERAPSRSGKEARRESCLSNGKHRIARTKTNAQNERTTTLGYYALLCLPLPLILSTGLGGASVPPGSQACDDPE